MLLFHSPLSPYVRKVTVLLRELEKTDAVTIKSVTSSVFDTDDSLKAANPLARLPALQRDEGVTLYDSRVITRYLDDLFDGGLYPEGSALWDCLALEATGDGIMDSAVSMAYEVRLRPASEQCPAWIEGQWEKVARALDALEGRWMAHLNGRLSMAQISVACALSYIDLRHDGRNWREGRNALAAWHATFESRPSMQATTPPVS